MYAAVTLLHVRDVVKKNQRKRHMVTCKKGVAITDPAACRLPSDTPTWLPLCVFLTCRPGKHSRPAEGNARRRPRLPGTHRKLTLMETVCFQCIVALLQQSCMLIVK